MGALRVGAVADDASKAGRRDAFHVPCVLVTSAESFTGGESCAFVDGKTVRSIRSHNIHRQAVVDPFVSGIIKPGQAFWVMVEPSMLVDDALTHHFSIHGLPSEIDCLKEQLDAANARAEKEEARAKELDDELSNDSCRGCYN